MYIKEEENISVTFETDKQASRWSTKLDCPIEKNNEIKIHWVLLNTSSFRNERINVKCDDCGLIHKRRIRDLDPENNYHLCKKCKNKGDRNGQHGKEKTEKQLNAIKKALKENGNPFTWETTKQKIKEKNPWVKTAEKNRGQKRSDEVKEKMSNSALLAFKEGRRKPTNGWGNIKIKQYKDIDYQSSYELKFLEHLYNLGKLHVIERGDKIQYISTDGKEHNYYIDYKIKNTNIAIEIKSSYHWEKQEDVNILKKEAAEKLYEYILIINNNFKELNKILEQYE